MTRENLAQFLSLNLLTSIQAAEKLGMSKQLLMNYVRDGRIKPILVTTQGSLFLRSDLERFNEARIEKMMSASPLSQEILFCQDTSCKCKNFFMEHRNFLGEIATVSIYFEEFDSIIDGNFQKWSKNEIIPNMSLVSVPHMIIRDFNGKEIWLSSCNCGYIGGGPNSSKEILQKIGVPEDMACKVREYDILSYYWDGAAWQVRCTNSYIRNYNPADHKCCPDHITANVFLYKNRLVLLQALYRDSYYDANPKPFLEKYHQFVPNPTRILLLNNTQAVEMGYIGYDSCGQIQPYNLIIIDCSRRELWLHLNLDDTRPIKKQYTLLELLKQCGFGIKASESLPDRLRTWLNSVPACTSVCELEQLQPHI